MGLKGPSRATGKGPYRHQTALWKGAEVVTIGDFIFKSASDHYDHSANIFTWNASLLQTQTDFKAVFRGVSEVRRMAAQTADGDQNLDGCIVCTGEFTFPCAALQAALYVANNTLVTIAQGTGSTLNAAKVVSTTVMAIAIGRLTRDAAVGATELTFELTPATYIDGPQAIS